MVDRRSWLVVVLCGALLAAPSGCQRQEQITRYRVLKPELLAEINRDQPNAAKAAAPVRPLAEAKDRMLAAIVPQGASFWFFKLAGPKDLVGEHVEEFTSFVKSVRFPDAADAKPEWTVPEGWSEQGGSEMRYATFKVGPGKNSPELTVVTLPQSGNLEDDLLKNVNRWRGQMQLPPIEQDQLADAQQFDVAGGKATMVDLLGTLAASSMGRPPFFKGGGDGK